MDNLVNEHDPYDLALGELYESRAVERNTHYMQVLGWNRYLTQIHRAIRSRAAVTSESFAAAVRRWQQREGLTADGIIGPHTWRRLKRRQKIGVLSTWEVRIAVRNNPRFASQLGYSLTGVDGKQFALAVAKWQSVNDLDVDGIAGPQTWRKLQASRALPSFLQRVVHRGRTPNRRPTPATRFFKDDAALLAAPLAPARPVTIQRGWSPSERQIAQTYNRLGGLMTLLARRMGVPVATVIAVWMKESNGVPQRPGNMTIRFENHVFFRQWGQRNRPTFDSHFRTTLNGTQHTHRGHQFRENPSDPWQNFHGNQTLEYRVLALARRLAGDEPALRSISMGGPQIMGFNHAIIGYPSALAMFTAFQTGERLHVLGFFDFVQHNRGGLLARHMRAANFREFARLYNGDPNYGTGMAQFDRIGQRILPP